MYEYNSSRLLCILKQTTILFSSNVSHFTSSNYGNLQTDMNPNEIINHLKKLCDRLENAKKSKIMIVGDLNAGKSTIVNALLRQGLVPIDQQPCTGVFIEIMDSEKEEIHSVDSLDNMRRYCIEDHSTYQKFDLNYLEHLNDTNSNTFLKVYIPLKTKNQLNILRNRVQDISLVDSPGLNIDSWTTTQLYSKQEEIDVLVYVISAENHLTQSVRN